MTDEGMAHLAGLRSLRTLGLYSCPDISDQGARHLEDLTSLQLLRLQFTGVSDATLDVLQDLETLRFLDVRGTGVTAERAADFRAARPRCRLVH